LRSTAIYCAYLCHDNCCRTDESPSRNAGLVIGNRDLEANAVSLRVHDKGNLGVKPRDEVLAAILQSIKERRA
jgi:hypothetical protein